MTVTIRDRAFRLRLTVGVVLALVVGLLPFAAGDAEVFSPARLSINYGFLLLEAYLVGGLFSRFGLPRISGYIATGILFGPHALGFLSHGWVERMTLIDDLALSFIALSAGCELKLSTLRARARAIGWVMGAMVVVVVSGIAATWVLASGLLPFAAGLEPGMPWVVGAIVGVIAIARSPTSAIAIINDSGARGPFTDTVFGITVAMDSLVILLFAITVSVGQAAVSGGAVDVGFLSRVAGQLLASLALGALLGGGLGYYMGRWSKDLSILLVVLAFVISEVSGWMSHLAEAYLGGGFHLEPLLIATAAGFTVQNFTKQGERLSDALRAVSLPIFVVFFSMTGAHLDLEAVGLVWNGALLFVGVRMALLAAAGFAGCRVAGEGNRFSAHCGLAFFTQAGVSLGLTQEVARRFPGWGPAVATFLVACITLNEIIGPVTFKLALDRMGETDKGS